MMILYFREFSSVKFSNILRKVCEFLVSDGEPSQFLAGERHHVPLSISRLRILRTPETAVLCACVGGYHGYCVTYAMFSEFIGVLASAIEGGNEEEDEEDDGELSMYFCKSFANITLSMWKFSVFTFFIP